MFFRKGFVVWFEFKNLMLGKLFGCLGFIVICMDVFVLIVIFLFVVENVGLFGFRIYVFLFSLFKLFYKFW